MQELLFYEVVENKDAPVFRDYYIATMTQGVVPYVFIATCPMKNGKPYFITGIREPKLVGIGYITTSVREFKAEKDLAWNDYYTRTKQ